MGQTNAYNAVTEDSGDPQFEEYKLLMGRLTNLYEESYSKVNPVDPQSYQKINKDILTPTISICNFIYQEVARQNGQFEEFHQAETQFIDEITNLQSMLREAEKQNDK